MDNHKSESKRNHPAAGRRRGKSLGREPMHDAAGAGQTEWVRTLLAEGCDADPRDDLARTPLMDACEGGHAEVAKLLIDAGAKVDCLSARAMSPLMLAAEQRSVECVRALLGAGARVDYGVLPGWTPLTWACQQGAREVVEELLASGASVAGVLAPADPERGEEPFDPGEEPVRCWEPLLSAAACGQAECAELLLAAGADVDARDEQGHTPLMMGVSSGSEACVRALMRAGSDPALVDAEGLSAPEMASSRVGGWGKAKAEAKAEERGRWASIMESELIAREIARGDGVDGLPGKPKKLRM